MPNAAFPSGSVVGNVCRAVLRQKTKAVFCCAAITAAVAVATFLWPKSYRSEGKLLVRLGRENATLDATATLGQESVVAVPVSRDSEINSVVEILQSRSLMEKVVDAVGVGRLVDGVSPADRERAVRLLTDGVRVAAAHKSNVVQVVFEGRSPELCQAVVGRLLTIYIDEHARLNRPQGSHEFFAEQAERLQRDLIAKEAALRDLKAATGLLSPDSQRQALVSRLDHMQDELLQADTAAAASEAKMRKLRQRLSGLSGDAGGRPDHRRRQRGDGPHARAVVHALQLAAEEAGSRYTRGASENATDSPADRRGEEDPRTPGADAHADDDGDEPELRGRSCRAAGRGAAAGVVAGPRRRASPPDGRPSRAIEGVRRRRVAHCPVAAGSRTLPDELPQVLDQRRGARIDQAMERERMSNLSVVQPASYEPRAIRPQKAICLAMGLLLGILGGVGAAVVADGRDRSLRTPEDIETKLDMPALGTVPQMRRRHLVVPGERRT